MFSNSRRGHVDRNADAGTSAEFDDFIMREYLHVNISTMKQIVASSVAESVHKDNIANSHDPSHLSLWNIWITSCVLFHPVIYINTIEIYISWIKLNFCCEKVTVVFQHWSFVESYWHWILRCVHLVILQKTCLSLKDVHIWNMSWSQTHAFPPSALSTGRRASVPKSLDK